jgi:hypothetical protein
MVLGGIGLLIAGGLIGAVVTGGLSFGADPEEPSGPRPSGAQTATIESSAPVGGLPLAATGSLLTTVTSPPARTLTYVTMEAGASVSYAVTFAPYGFAPSTLGDDRLVVRIMSARSSGEGVNIGLTGMNAVVGVESGALDVTVGGTYQATIEVRQEADGRGALYLTEVMPAP